MYSKSNQLQKNNRLRELLPQKTERLCEPEPKKTQRLREEPIITAERIKAKPLKDPNYLDWFHGQNFGCLVCATNNIEAHHVLRGTEGRPDDSVIPLCPEHHRGRYSPHGFDSDKFAEEYPKDLQLEIAKRLFIKFQLKEQ